MLYAGNNIKARRIFERTVTHRPPIRLTIRQGCGVLEQWPRRPKIDGDDGDDCGSRPAAPACRQATRSPGPLTPTFRQGHKNDFRDAYGTCLTS